MLLQIDDTLGKCIQILLGEIFSGNSTIILQSAHSCNQNYCIRLKTSLPALDIQELLSA